MLFRTDSDAITFLQSSLDESGGYFVDDQAHVAPADLLFTLDVGQPLLEARRGEIEARRDGHGPGAVHGFTHLGREYNASFCCGGLDHWATLAVDYREAGRYLGDLKVAATFPGTLEGTASWTFHSRGRSRLSRAPAPTSAAGWR
jgi:hypothetical protein